MQRLVEPNKVLSSSMQSGAASNKTPLKMPRLAFDEHVTGYYLKAAGGGGNIFTHSNLCIDSGAVKSSSRRRDEKGISNPEAASESNVFTLSKARVCVPCWLQGAESGATIRASGVFRLSASQLMRRPYTTRLLQSHSAHYETTCLLPRRGTYFQPRC